MAECQPGRAQRTATSGRSSEVGEAASRRELVRTDAPGYALVLLYRYELTYRSEHTSGMASRSRTQSTDGECRGYLGSARNPQLGGARGARQEQIGYRMARIA